MSVTDGWGERPIFLGSRSSPPVRITPSSRSRIGARSASLIERRDDDRQRVRRQQAVVVAAVHEAVGRASLDESRGSRC